MSYATASSKGPSTVDCEVLTDIHTQSNLAEVEIVSLVQELIPRYRLRAETDFVCSNEDFIQTPHINGSNFEPLTNQQIRALLDYYSSSSNRISQMTKTYHDMNAVTRMLEDRENDLQMAVNLGFTLLSNNDSLRNQVSLLEKDIEQTTEIVKQLKHDLILKERLIRFYSDLDDEYESIESNQINSQHYEQKIRNLEYQNQELRSESLQLKLDSENFEQQEQAIVDHFAHALANANTDIDSLQTEVLKKADENLKQQEEIRCLSKDMFDVHQRLKELKKENEELKVLLSLTGKTRHEYETKIEELEKNYSECLLKLEKSQEEINSLQKNFIQNSPSTPMNDFNSSHHQTVFLSPIEYANYMSLENSLKSELEEILEDPNQLHSSKKSLSRRSSRRRAKRASITDLDGDSSMNDSAFSDTESLSSASSCRFCQRSSPIPIDDLKSISNGNERRLPTGVSSKLRLVKRLEGSNMLKRWKELAEPSFSSCLQTIPGVYTRAEILQEVNEEDEDELLTPQNDFEERLSISLDRHSPETPIHSHSNQRINLVALLTKQGLTARTIKSSEQYSDFERAFLTCPLPNRFQKPAPIPDFDDDEDENSSSSDEEPTTPPSSPTHGAQFQTSALLHQVMQRLMKLSLNTFETLATTLTSSNQPTEISPQRLRRVSTITPPSSPTFDGPAAPTPNTAMHAIKTSAFLRASSLNPFMKKTIRNVFNSISPMEGPSLGDEFLKGCLPRL